MCGWEGQEQHQIKSRPVTSEIWHFFRPNVKQQWIIKYWNPQFPLVVFILWQNESGKTGVGLNWCFVFIDGIKVLLFDDVLGIHSN